MGNWLQKFLILFPEATEKRTSKRQRMEEVEAAVSGVRSNLKIDLKTLRVIEECEAWNYPWFWPKMSEIVKVDIPIPADLTIKDAKHKLIGDLYDQLQHIEVVSVILRFIWPEEFGIMSPPVLSFLRLSPLSDSVSYYEQFLRVLGQLKNQYQLERVADVDMAIWSASHLYIDPTYEAVAEEMREDNYFQKILFENAISGWGSISRQTKIDHMLFAEAFLKHDYLISGIIAARVLEETLHDLGRRLGVKAGTRKGKQSETAALKDKIKNKERELQKISVSPGDLDTWWGWRNDAIHPERQITKKNASDFVSAICKFHSAVMRYK